MVWTVLLQSESATSTVNLNDQVETFLSMNGLYAPPPQPQRSLSGGNLLRHGADLIRQTYTNRDVTIGLDLKGTNSTALIAVVQNIWEILRKARDYKVSGVGTQIQLRYQWEGAAAPVFFNVIDGQLDLGQGLHSNYLRLGTIVRDARLTLFCEPFAYGTAETLENYIKDPSFEIAATPLADWTLQLGTGTITRSTTRSKYGTAAARFEKTGGTADFRIYQSLVLSGTSTLASGTGAAFSTFFYNETNTQAVAITIEFFNTSGTALNDAASGSSTSTGTWLPRTVSLVATGTIGTIRTGQWYNRTGTATGTGTGYADGAMLVLGSTAIPTAWISGRAVANHFDDNGQAHINYVDLYDIPGDMPAPMQIRATEAEAHVEFYLGARHAGRQGQIVWLEAESFTGLTAVSSAGFSNGSYGSASINSTATDATSPVIFSTSIATPPPGIYRILSRHQVSTLIDPNGTVHFGIGYSYGGATVNPNATGQYPVHNRGTLTFPYQDLGAMRIPPIITPPGGSVGSLILNIAVYKSALPTTAIPINMDSLILIPADYGFGYGSKTSAADVVWADSRSQMKGYYIMDGSSVKSIPAAQQGDPPLADPDGSRVYFVVNDDSTSGSIASGFNVQVVYTPRFLHVR